MTAVSLEYPSLARLCELAREGKREEVVLGIAKRLDAAETTRYLAALRSFEWITDRPKASVTEARLAGDIEGPIPETPEYLAKIILEACGGQHE